MSPNPGEPGHETDGWTHAICDVDYFTLAPAKGWAVSPHRVVDPEHNREPTSEACCYCGRPTRGVYVRQNAREVHALDRSRSPG